MIPANNTTLAEEAYALAIEMAEKMSKRYHRLAFWIPLYGRGFLVKARMWDYKLAKFKNHAQYLGAKPKKTEWTIPKEDLYKITITAGGGTGGSHDTSIPPRVGFGE